MQKSSLLKVISILFIIFGALSLLSSLGKFTENAAYGGIGIGTSVFALAAAALELAAGILTGVIVMVFALLLPVLYMIGIKKSRA